MCFPQKCHLCATFARDRLPLQTREMMQIDEVNQKEEWQGASRRGTLEGGYIIIEMRFSRLLHDKFYCDHDDAFASPP